MNAARLTLLERHPLPKRDDKDISAVAPLGGGFALLAHDDRGVMLLSPDGKVRLLRGPHDARGLGDLESLCVSDDGATAYALSEDKGELYAFDVLREEGTVQLSPPRMLGILPRPGKDKNRGWEGLAYLSNEQAFGGVGGLLVAHQDKPRALVLFGLPDLRERAFTKLDGKAAKLLDNVSDIAVCPQTGHLFLLSAASLRVVEATWNLEPDGLQVVGESDLGAVLDKRSKPEGLGFESAERLVVVTDASGEILRFRVDR